jgi:hypothetical protein
MIESKIIFLRETMPALLQKLQANQQGAWGKLNAQQMVEHFTDAVKLAYGHFLLPAVSEGEQLQKMYNFMMSDTPFRENTVNPYMGKEPAPLRKATMQDAITSLQNALQRFFEYYEQHPGSKTLNPFFGELNVEEQVHLLHKHAQHHLRQFGLL